MPRSGYDSVSFPLWSGKVADEQMDWCERQQLLWAHYLCMLRYVSSECWC